MNFDLRRCSEARPDESTRQYLLLAAYFEYPFTVAGLVDVTLFRWLLVNSCCVPADCVSGWIWLTEDAGAKTVSLSHNMELY